MIKANNHGNASTAKAVSRKLTKLINDLEVLGMLTSGEGSQEISRLKRVLIEGIREQGDGRVDLMVKSNGKTEWKVILS